MDEKWFFEISDTLLNRDILVVNRISKAPINDGRVFSGMQAIEINLERNTFRKRTQ